MLGMLAAGYCLPPGPRLAPVTGQGLGGRDEEGGVGTCPFLLDFGFSFLFYCVEFVFYFFAVVMGR